MADLEKAINVRVDEETRQALDAEAEKRGVKLAWLVRHILTEYAKNNDLYTIRIPAIPFTGKGDEIGRLSRALPAIEAIMWIKPFHISPERRAQLESMTPIELHREHDRLDLEMVKSTDPVRVHEILGECIIIFGLIPAPKITWSFVKKAV
jgi:hypothetical protein